MSDFTKANEMMPVEVTPEKFPPLPHINPDMPHQVDPSVSPEDGRGMPPHSGPGCPPFGGPGMPPPPPGCPPFGGPGMPPPPPGCPPFGVPDKGNRPFPPHGGPDMNHYGEPSMHRHGDPGMHHHGGPGMPPPPPGRPIPENWEDEDELSGLLRHCGHRLIHQGGSGKRQEQILKLLYEFETLSQRELLDIMKIQPGSLSELLAKLETKALIARERKAEDRRIMMITLTPKGLALTESLSGASSSMLYAGLSEEEQETLKTLLKKLLDSWKEDDKGPRPPRHQGPGGFINC